jgi:hypothetical protein
LLNVQCGQQSVDHARDLLGLLHHFGNVALLEEFQARREFQLSLQLKQLPSSGRQELPEMAIVEPSVAFCNIAGDRNGSSAHLRLKSEEFLRWQSLCLEIDGSGQIHGFLPKQQVAKVPRSSVAPGVIVLAHGRIHALPCWLANSLTG